MIQRRPRSANRRGPGLSSPTGSFIVDRDGTILGYDDGMEALTGRPAAAIVGHSKDAPLSGQDGEISRRGLYEGTIAIPRRSDHRILRLHCHDGSDVHAEVSVRRLAGPGDRAQITVLRIVARTRVGQERSSEGRDPRTGLLDAGALRDQLELDVADARRRSTPMAIVLMDVDHLRHVNDDRGRETGDAILRTLGDILRVHVGDELRVGRLADDDFCAILPGAGRGDARQLAAALRSHVEEFEFDGAGGPPARVTVSLGAASMPADAQSGDELLSRAREALDEARALGRNRVWCYLRRPRVPVEVPVFFDGSDGLLVGYTRDLSPSGVFVQTSAPIEIGMRCAFNFPLPGLGRKVHVIGRIVRAVPPDMSPATGPTVRIPGMGVEFERFGGPQDSLAIESFLHATESTTERPEIGPLSV